MNAKALCILAIVLAALLPTAPLMAQADDAGGGKAKRTIQLDPPGQRDFILDKADLISADDETRIRKTCDKLLTGAATPIVVVTIESTRKYDGGIGMHVRAFAILLFDQWGIGHATIDGKEANTGILLLVSKGDRKARIELGAAWGRSHDQMCRRIMDERIVPRFKRSDFSGGIRAGVEALDRMARLALTAEGAKTEPKPTPAPPQGEAAPPKATVRTDRPPTRVAPPTVPLRTHSGPIRVLPRPRAVHSRQMPSPARSWWFWALPIAAVAIVVWTVTSAVRRGAGGSAARALGGIGSAVGEGLYHLATRPRRRSTGSLFSGGGFRDSSFGSLFSEGISFGSPFGSSFGHSSGGSSFGGFSGGGSSGGGSSGGSFGGGSSGGGGATGSW